MAVTQFINSALGTPVDYLTTELNALAGDGLIVGAAIENTSRDMMLKVQINLAAVDLSAQSGPGVIIRLIESIDGGTTYEDDDATCYGITLPLEIGSTSQVHVRVGDLYVPQGHFKLGVVNGSGVAFAATGNVLSYALYTPETDI